MHPAEENAPSTQGEYPPPGKTRVTPDLSNEYEKEYSYVQAYSRST